MTEVALIIVSVIWWVLFTAIYFRRELTAFFAKKRKTATTTTMANVMGKVTPLPLVASATEEENELDVEVEYGDNYMPPSDELPDFEEGFNPIGGDEIDDSVTPLEVEHLVDTVKAPPTSIENERKAAQTAKKIEDTDFFEQLKTALGKPASTRVTEAIAAWEEELRSMRTGSESTAEDKPTKEFDISKYI
jgi:hypothetical protein